MSYPLAILDSIEITIQRTGAATAVAAKHLARRNSHRAAVCGCGTQGRVQLAALLEALPITHACAWDREEEAARRYAREMSERLSISVAPVKDPGECIRGSDVIVACTPSREPYITREQLSPGCFISAIGADGPDKQELESEALRGHKLVVDILEQCARAGELHHAIENGVMARGDVYGTLGEVVSGKKPGRESSNEIIIFDATGTAIQDVAGAAACYEKALAAGAGKYIRLYE
jgi:ornithine cyclodeaminase/alanine dehydrogenase